MRTSSACACAQWLLLLTAHAALALCSSISTGAAYPIAPAHLSAVDCVSCVSSGGACSRAWQNSVAAAAAAHHDDALDRSWIAHANWTKDGEAVTTTMMRLDRANTVAFVFVRPSALAQARAQPSLRRLRLERGVVDEPFAEIEVNGSTEAASFALVYPNAVSSAAPIAALISDPATNQVVRFSLLSRERDASWKVANPSALVVDPAGEFAYVISDSTTIVRINLAADAVDSTWGTAAALSKPSKLQLDSARGLMYVLDKDAEGALALRLHISTGSHDAFFTAIRLSRSPTDWALDAARSRLFLAYDSQPSLTVVDLLDAPRGEIVDHFVSSSLPASVASIAVDAEASFLYVAPSPAAAKSESSALLRIAISGGGAWTWICERGAEKSSRNPRRSSVSSTAAAIPHTISKLSVVGFPTCSSAGGYTWNAVTQVAFVLMLLIFVLLAVALSLSCVPAWQPLPLHGHSLPSQHCFSRVLSPLGLRAHVVAQFLLLVGMLFALAFDSWALSRIDSAGTPLVAGLVRLRLDGTNLPILDCLGSAMELPQKLQCMSIKAGSGLTLACGLVACATALSILVLSVQALRESDPFTPFIWRLSCIQAAACTGTTLFFSIPALLTLQAVVHCGFQPWVSWYTCASATTLSLYLCWLYRRAVLDFPAKSPMRCMVQSIKQPAPPQELPSKALKRGASAFNHQLETTNDLRRLNGLEPLYPGQTEETEMDRWETQQVSAAEEDRLAAALGPRPKLLPASSFSPSAPSSSRSISSYSLRSPHMPPPAASAVYSPYAATPSVTSAASLYQISEDAAHNGGSGGDPVGWPAVTNGYAAPSSSAAAVDAQLQLQSQYQGALHNDDDASSYYAHHVALTQAARMIDDGSGVAVASGSPLALDHLQLGSSLPPAGPRSAVASMSVTPSSSARRLAPVQSTRQATLLAQFRTSSNSPRPF